MHCWKTEQLGLLSDTESDAAFRAELTRITQELGFKYWSYLLRIPTEGQTAPRLLDLSNYPEAWRARYAGRNYCFIDPTLEQGACSVLPFVWTEELFSSVPEMRTEMRNNGIEFGWSQSCYDGKGLGGLLSLSRSSGAIIQQELLDKSDRMSWLAQAVHETLGKRLPVFLPQARIGLTTREIDVLRWSADGRTAHEISHILAISERTVNFHVNNSLIKLQSQNKTAAVVKAARLGLL